MDQAVGLFWAFHVHADDEDFLRAQIDREHVGELDLAIATNAFDQGLDDNVDLMRHTPDPQNLVLGTHDNASHDIGMPAYHGVLTVSRHADQLCTPLAIQRVHKLANHIEDIEPHVSLKHRHSHQVQVHYIATVANGQVQVKKRLAAMCAAISDQQHDQDGFMINHVNNLLQRDGD